MFATMSNMTSSSTATAIRAGKILTDFSIKTIIEGQSNYKSNQQQQSDNNNRNERNSTINSTRNRSSLGSMEQTQLQQTRANLNEGSNSNRKYRPKNFQCSACKMAFSNNGQLKTHVRIHTGERPFMCNHPDCSKTFTRNEELTRHKNIHTGFRPHSCTSCGKSFGRKDHLKKHVRTHDRKRLRKEVFVPARACIEDDMFVPPKPARSINSDDDTPGMGGETRLLDNAPSPNLTSLINNDLTLTSQPTPSTPIPAPAHAPLTSSLDHYEHHQVPYHHANSDLTALTSSDAPITSTTTTTSTNSAIHQLASDYWNKWYNLLGFYQHQYQYQPVDRLGGLIRK